MYECCDAQECVHECAKACTHMTAGVGVGMFVHVRVKACVCMNVCLCVSAHIHASFSQAIPRKGAYAGFRPLVSGSFHFVLKYCPSSAS